MEDKNKQEFARVVSNTVIPKVVTNTVTPNKQLQPAPWPPEWGADLQSQYLEGPGQPELQETLS